MVQIIKVLVIAMLLHFGFSLSYAQDDIQGIWILTKHNAKVEIYKKGGKYHGVIVDVNHEESKLGMFDIHNPDEELRGEPLIGAKILWDMEKDGNRWGGGEIYDPQTGRTYSCRITKVSADEITVRGYIGRPFLGRNQTWNRD